MVFEPSKYFSVKCEIKKKRQPPVLETYDDNDEGLNYIYQSLYDDDDAYISSVKDGIHFGFIIQITLVTDVLGFRYYTISTRTVLMNENRLLMIVSVIAITTSEQKKCVMKNVLYVPKLTSNLFFCESSSVEGKCCEI